MCLWAVFTVQQAPAHNALGIHTSGGKGKRSWLVQWLQARITEGLVSLLM